MFFRSHLTVTSSVIWLFRNLQHVFKNPFESIATFRILCRCTVLCRRFSFENHQMSKKDKAGNKCKNGKKAAVASEAAASIPGAVTRDRSGVVTISVHAKPGSRQNAITDVSPETVGVAIAAVPTDGEANIELLRFLAQVLKVKKGQVSIDKGARARNKTVKVESLSPEEVMDRLKQAALDP